MGGLPSNRLHSSVPAARRRQHQPDRRTRQPLKPGMEASGQARRCTLSFVGRLCPAVRAFPTPSGTHCTPAGAAGPGFCPHWASPLGPPGSFRAPDLASRALYCAVRIPACLRFVDSGCRGISGSACCREGPPSPLVRLRSFGTVSVVRCVRQSTLTRDPYPPDTAPQLSTRIPILLTMPSYRPGCQPPGYQDCGPNHSGIPHNTPRPIHRP